MNKTKNFDQVQSVGISKMEGTIAVKKKNDQEFVITFDQPKLKYTYGLYVSKDELINFVSDISEILKQEAPNE